MPVVAVGEISFLRGRNNDASTRGPCAVAELPVNLWTCRCLFLILIKLDELADISRRMLSCPNRRVNRTLTQAWPVSRDPF